MATNVGAKKRAGIILVVIGVVLLAGTFWSGGGAGDFGPAKIAGLVIGALVMLIGFVLTRKKGHTTTPPA